MTPLGTVIIGGFSLLVNIGGGAKADIGPINVDR